MRHLATAPANIALIKYMGKTDANKNVPSNASFSYTLDHLLSFVELETYAGTQDQWEPLKNITANDFEAKNTTAKNTTNLQTPQLSEKGKQRFLQHLAHLKKQFNYSDHFILRSANNFAADCGLASSASSFAALTKCAFETLCELTQQSLPTPEQQAHLSQAASGSSCRSFHGPWVLWAKTSIEPIALPYTKLIHAVIVVAKEKKAVASSLAHQRITTSLLFKHRSERAEQRLQQLLQQLRAQDWQAAYQTTWQEFWDMHALFETTGPPFGYMTHNSLAVLNDLRQGWQEKQDGPLITMDAGPNIHLLWRPEQHSAAQEIVEHLGSRYTVITNLNEFA